MYNYTKQTIDFDKVTITNCTYTLVTHEKNFIYMYIYRQWLSLRQRMASYLGYPCGTTAGRIAYLTFRPALPDGKICRLSVRHCIFIKLKWKK